MNHYMYPSNAKEEIVSYFIIMLEYIAETKFLCPLEDIMACD